MDPTDSQPALTPSAQLARLHALASNHAQNSNNSNSNNNGSNALEVPAVDEPTVPSPEDPVVVDNAAFAEPIIAGDGPMPVSQAHALPAKEKKRKEKLDLSSESAFPSLSGAGNAPRPPALSAWSASSAAKVKANAPAPASGRHSPHQQRKQPASAGPSVTDVLELPANQQIANQPNKPLGFKGNADVIQQVMQKSSTNIIASTNRSGTTTFLIQGASADVARAKRELLAGLVVKRTVEITVPSSTRRFIIGTQGKTLKQIEAKSNVRVNFPPRSAGEEEYKEGQEDEPVAVTLVGDAAGIAIAKADIDKIVGEKAAKLTVKVTDIDHRFYLHVAGPKSQTLQAIEQQTNVKIQMPPLVGPEASGPIALVGDKEKIEVAKSALIERYEELKKAYRTIAFAVPKRQHKYILGKDGVTLREIFEESGCTIELPEEDETTENITVRGPDDKLIPGLQLAMEKARAVYVNVLELTELHGSAPDRVQHARAMLKFLVSKGSFASFETEHGVQTIVPTLVPTAKSVPVEFVSRDEKDMINAYKEAYEACLGLVPDLVGFANVEAYLHRHLAIRHAKALQRIKARHHVEIFFPDEKEDGEVSSVTIVYDPKDVSAEDKLAAAKEALAGAAADIEKLAAESSDFVSKTIPCASTYHAQIAGPNDTTLNALVGSETAVTVRFHGEEVNVRGPDDEVTKAVRAIQGLVAAIKEGDYVESYTIEFMIPSAYSAHVIGKAGANINKLKEELGVKVDISDPSAPSEDGFKSTKKSKNQQVKVVIQGIKANVQAAQDRISALVATLADQVTVTIHVPRAFHRYLIGPNGRYVRKLEDKYNVYIKFSKSSTASSSSSSTENGGASPEPSPSGDAITIRGRKKDANSAKEELVELYEYEKEEQEKRSRREAQHQQHQQRMNEKNSKKSNKE
ncbi:hypothetical protein BCR43DRAFT_481564 [Syncephalastrum racemosum]|uniref:K Homology domain-containing protein n=1 Tax=Syncephalastrum racemosum TaxID=13706 RepID=A0A1X2HSE0_SYNRA|nr:hypothetical protein BCR43DRAFT_481564 [Syncephalastrum racemosum]